MRERKLIQQLKILNPAEFKGLYLFIRSPYYNKSEDLIRFFDRIRKYYPDFDSPQLQKEKLFQKLFPNQFYSDIKLRNLHTKLSKIVDNYFIQLDYEADDFKKKKLLTQIYGQRNLYSEFERGTHQLLATLDKQPYRDASYYYEKYLLEQAYYFHIQTERSVVGRATLIQDALDNLGFFFSLERLCLGLDLKNRMSIFKEEHDFIIDNYVPPVPEESITYHLYHLIYQLFDKRTDQYYKRLFKLLSEKIYQLRPEHSKNAFYVLSNYAMQGPQKKDTIYLERLFALHQLGIAHQLPFEGGQIEHNTFLNIVQVASKLKMFDWVEEFINTHKNRICSKEPMVALALGTLRFHQACYEEVIPYLATTNFSSLVLIRYARILLLRTYYHLFEADDSYYDLLRHQCDAFYKYLYRNESFEPTVRIAYLQFYKILKSVVELVYQKKWTETKKQELLALLNSPDKIVLRGWLEEIILSI